MQARRCCWASVTVEKSFWQVWHFSRAFDPSWSALKAGTGYQERKALDVINMRL